MNAFHSLLYENIVPFFGQWYCNKEIPVIFYHDVVCGTGMGNARISMDNFCRQLGILQENGFETLTLQEVDRSFSKRKNEKKILITFDDGWASNYHLVFPEMKKRNLKFNIFLSAGLIGSDSEKYMTWEQVRQMAQSGLVGFGAHTYSHFDCKRKMSSEEFQREFLDANRMISENVGYEVRDFCFPHGLYCADVIEPIVKAGIYDKLYTTNSLGVVQHGQLSIVGRFGIEDDNSPKVFLNKALGRYRIMEPYLKLRRGREPFFYEN